MAVPGSFTFDPTCPTSKDYARSRSFDIFSRKGDGSMTVPWWVADETINSWLADGNNDNEVAAMICESMAMGFNNLALEVKQVDVMRKFQDRAKQCTDMAVSLRNSQRSGGPGAPAPTGSGFGFIQTPSLIDYPDALPGRCGPGVGRDGF